MFEMFSLKELKEADRTLSDAFSFTKGAPVMKIPATPESSPQNTCYMYDDHLKYGDLLFDLQTDPREEKPDSGSRRRKQNGGGNVPAAPQQRSAPGAVRADRHSIRARRDVHRKNTSTGFAGGCVSVCQRTTQTPPFLL